MTNTWWNEGVPCRTRVPKVDKNISDHRSATKRQLNLRVSMECRNSLEELRLKCGLKTLASTLEYAVEVAKVALEEG